MNNVEKAYDTLRRDVAAVEIAPFIPVPLEMRRRSRIPSAAPWALAATLVAVPAFAAVYSHYAADNATARSLAAALSKTTGKSLHADVIVSEQAPRAELAFKRQGFHVVRSATFQSGATSVELATDRGQVVVVVSPKSTSSSAKSVMLIPRGSAARFYRSEHDVFRHGLDDHGYIVETPAGPNTVFVSMARPVPRAEWRRIIAAAGTL
jgi:hypothetical protein